eukprot:403364060
MILPNTQKKVQIVKDKSPAKNLNNKSPYASLKTTPQKVDQSPASKLSQLQQYVMSYSIEYGLLRILQKEIQLVRSLENNKRELQAKLQDPINLYYSVKGGRQSESSLKNSDVITKADLTQFINIFKITSFKPEALVDFILKRIDKDFDDQLKYSDFIELIQPMTLNTLKYTNAQSCNSESPTRKQIQQEFQKELEKAQQIKSQDINSVLNKLSKSPLRVSELIKDSQFNEQLQSTLNDRTSSCKKQNMQFSPARQQPQNQENNLKHQPLRRSRGEHTRSQSQEMIQVYQQSFQDAQNVFSPSQNDREKTQHQSFIEVNSPKSSLQHAPRPQSSNFTQSYSQIEQQIEKKQSNTKSTASKKQFLEEIKEDTEKEEYYHIHQTPIDQLKNPPTQVQKLSYDLSPMRNKTFLASEFSSQNILGSQSLNQHEKSTQPNLNFDNLRIQPE